MLKGLLVWQKQASELAFLTRKLENVGFFGVLVDAFHFPETHSTLSTDINNI